LHGDSYWLAIYPDETGVDVHDLAGIGSYRSNPTSRIQRQDGRTVAMPGDERGDVDGMAGSISAHGSKRHWAARGRRGCGGGQVDALQRAPRVTTTVVVDEVTGPKLAVTSEEHALGTDGAAVISPLSVPIAAQVWLDNTQIELCPEDYVPC